MRPAGIAPVLLALALPTAAQQAQRTDSPTVEDAVKRITHYVWSIQKK